MIKIDREKLKKILPYMLVFIGLLLLYKFYQNHRSLTITPPKVTVALPKSVIMADYVTQTGNTVALNSVDLVARVEGYLDKINFVDGTFVKKGTTLLVIEPQPYFEKLKEAEASLAAQKAMHAYDKSEYARQQRMYKENATSLNNVEKWLAKSEESEAEVAKAQANVEIAKINYSYTHIEAPFNGRIGRHMIDKGNLVGHGQATILATIEQYDPMYIYFNLNEIDFLKLRKIAKKNGIDEKVLGQIPVIVDIDNDPDYHFEGNLDFVNTGLDANTGTMEIRALLPNKSLDLVPGLFVQIRVAESLPRPQLTVPDEAVLYDQIGPYLLLVDSTNKVYLQRVTLGSLEKNRRAILQGLTLKDNVIVNGLQFASPDNLVTPEKAKQS